MVPTVFKTVVALTGEVGSTPTLSDVIPGSLHYFGWVTRHKKQFIE